MSELLFTNHSKNPVFTCSHCLRYYSHTWNFVHGPMGSDPRFPKSKTVIDSDPYGEENLLGVIQASCNSCDEVSFWLKSKHGSETQVYPTNFANFPQPNKDMPEYIKNIYKEAGSVMHLSLGASAALSRLTLEKLLIHLGNDKDSLFESIRELEKNRDISSTLKQKLYVIRKIGNTGAHSGSISFEEEPEAPRHLLNIINDIVDELITKPKTLEDLKKFIQD